MRRTGIIRFRKSSSRGKLGDLLDVRTISGSVARRRRRSLQGDRLSPVTENHSNYPGRPAQGPSVPSLPLHCSHVSLVFVAPYNNLPAGFRSIFRARFFLGPEYLFPLCKVVRSTTSLGGKLAFFNKIPHLGKVKAPQKYSDWYGRAATNSASPTHPVRRVSVWFPSRSKASTTAWGTTRKIISTPPHRFFDSQQTFFAPHICSGPRTSPVVIH